MNSETVGKEFIENVSSPFIQITLIPKILLLLK